MAFHLVSFLLQGLDGRVHAHADCDIFKSGRHEIGTLRQGRSVQLDLLILCGLGLFRYGRNPFLAADGLCGGIHVRKRF